LLKQREIFRSRPTISSTWLLRKSDLAQKLPHGLSRHGFRFIESFDHPRVLREI